jgi:hypothetical protein
VGVLWMGYIENAITTLDWNPEENILLKILTSQGENDSENDCKEIACKNIELINCYRVQCTFIRNVATCLPDDTVSYSKGP